mgnify:FL=1
MLCDMLPTMETPIIDSFVYYIPSIVTYFFIILFIIDFFVTLKRGKVHR